MAQCDLAMVPVNLAQRQKLKPAEVETGAKVMVPLFIEMGEKIRISSADGSYVERVR